MDRSILLEHFDNARPGRFHVLMIALIGSCWLLGAYCVTIVGFLLPSLKAEWQVTTTELGVIASVGMAGMFLGSIVAGTLADRLGRKYVMTIGLVFMGLVFLGSAAAPSFYMLLFFRLLTGAGFGAILPVSSTYVIEFSPSKQRGAMTVLLNACWGLGGVVSALVGYFLVLHYGWRPALALGGVSLLIAPVIWFCLPESIRFLLSHNRMDDAWKEVSRIHLQPDSAPLLKPDEFVSGYPAEKFSGIRLWSPEYRHITASLWILWFSLNFLYQGAYIWLPTLLGSVRIAEGRSFLLTLLISIGQLPGTFLVAYLADRISRKKVLVTSLICLATGAFLFGLSQADTWILIFGFVLMVCNGMVWGIAYPFSSELYPTQSRASATGWATGVGRLGGAIAPFLVSWIIASGGNLNQVFNLLAVFPLLSAILLQSVRLESTGRSLEEIG